MSEPPALIAAVAPVLRKMRASSARRQFWALARREAEAHGRREVWLADVLAALVDDSGVREVLQAVGRDPAALREHLQQFQSRDEVTHSAPRSGTFQIGEDAHSWPLDRALDRAIEERTAGHKLRPVRAVDVLLACLHPSEQQNIASILDDPAGLCSSLREHLKAKD